MKFIKLIFYKRKLKKAILAHIKERNEQSEKQYRHHRRVFNRLNNHKIVKL